MAEEFKQSTFKNKVREILKKYKVSYDSAAETLIADILQRINAGNPVSKSVDEALRETGFQGAYQEAVSEAVYLAACAGFGVLPEQVTDKATTAIKQKLLSDSWAPDDMSLSRRLHTLDVRNKTVQTIRSSMQKMQSMKEMAMELYDGYNSGNGIIKSAGLSDKLADICDLAVRAAQGDKDLVAEVRKKAQRLQRSVDNLKTEDLKAAYSDFAKACSGNELNEKVISRAARVAVQEKTRYYAERIARTEAVRAWFDGYIAERQGNSDIWGYRWRLSSRHPFYDQCDVCAHMNVGYGRGIYPKNKVPSIPRHPHCMCMLEDVFSWEQKGNEIHPDDAREYIDGLSDAKRMQLFGADGAEKYDAGGDWQELLRGWDGFEKPKSRLSKDDFQLQTLDKNGKIKEMDIAEKIRKSIIENGPTWKDDKLKIHLEKRKKLGHIPADWTVEDYNAKIIDIVSDKRVEIYKYYLDGFNQNYYVYGLPKWIVIVGEDGIVETSFPVDRVAYNEYLNPRSGYFRIK
jgi:hypothetical protein